MLVLSRMENEFVYINAFDGRGKPVEITISVVEIRGDKVKLGCSAPRRIAIHRGEVAAEIAGVDLADLERTAVCRNREVANGK